MSTIELMPHRPDADSFDLAAALTSVSDACRMHTLAVVATALMTVAIVGAYIYLWPPVYRAEVVLAADPDKDPQRDNFYDFWNIFRKEPLTTEVEKLTARPVIAAVVTKLYLSYDDVYHPFLSHAGYLWAESWMGRRYRAIKHALFPDKMSLYGPTPEEQAMGRTVNDFKDGVSLRPVPDSTVGTLVVLGPSPRVASMANELVATHLANRRQRFVDEARTAHDALAPEVEKARADLDESAQRRRAYYEANGLILEFEKDKVDVSKTAELDAAIRNAEAEMTALAQKKAIVQSLLLSERPETVTARTYQQSSAREQMKLARVALEAALDDLRLRYRPDSPDVRELEARIDGLGGRIDGEPPRGEQAIVYAANPTYEQLRQRDLELTAEISSMHAGLAARHQIADALHDRLSQLPRKITEATRLSREEYVLEQRYKFLRERFMMASVSMATAGATAPAVRVIDYASPPGDASWPRPKLLLLGSVFVGLAGGVVLAVLLETLHGRVTVSRLRRMQGDVSVLGPLHLSYVPSPAALLAGVQPDNETAAHPRSRTS